jgi:hypothetical protein
VALVVVLQDVYQILAQEQWGKDLAEALLEPSGTQVLVVVQVEQQLLDYSQVQVGRVQLQEPLFGLVEVEVVEATPLNLEMVESVEAAEVPVVTEAVSELELLAV